MLDMDPIRHFLKTFPPSDTSPAPEELIQRYQGILPGELLRIWRESGTGKYGQGILEIIDPREYQECLDNWQVQTNSQQQIPIMIGAFGNIFYWRDHGDHKEIAYLDPNTSYTKVYCNLPDNSLAPLLQKLTDDPEQDVLTAYGLFGEALALNGTLPQGQIYSFTPPLRLGGEMDAQSILPADSVVHLAALRQLADDETLTSDLPDPDDEFEPDLQRYEAAIQKLQHGLDPNSPDPKTLMRIGRLWRSFPYWEATDSDSSHEQAYQQTVQHFQQALQIEERPEWLIELGDAHYHMGLFKGMEESRLAYERHIQLMQERGEDPIAGQHGLIQVAWLHDQYDEIISVASTIPQRHPHDRSMIDMARAYQGKGNYQKALELFRKWELLEPYPENLSSTWQGEIECLLSMGRTQEARDQIRQLRSRYPEYHSELNSMMRDAQVNSRKLKESIDETRRIIQETDASDPMYPLELHTLAQNLHVLERYNEALGTIDLAIKANDKMSHPEGFYHRLKAEILTSMGRRNAAIASYQRALEVDPSIPDVKEQLASLESERPRGLLARLFRN